MTVTSNTIAIKAEVEWFVDRVELQKYRFHSSTLKRVSASEKFDPNDISNRDWSTYLAPIITKIVNPTATIKMLISITHPTTLTFLDQKMLSIRVTPYYLHLSAKKE